MCICTEIPRRKPTVNPTDRRVVLFTQNGTGTNAQGQIVIDPKAQEGEREKAGKAWNDMNLVNGCQINVTAATDPELLARACRMLKAL